MTELYGMQRIYKLVYVTLAREPWKGHRPFPMCLNGAAKLDIC
jgi:hypothetical protein